jgi:AcrR family transcriptional regulator
MGRKSGRSAEDTRRVVLDAAAEVVRTHGVATSIDVIARRADISKGGVLYHFTSKDALLLALAAEMTEGFREEVYAEVDQPEGTPGRLTRAYVKASVVPVEGRVARERFALITQLLALPAVLELVTADAERWERELNEDGVPQATLVLVVAAADGFGGLPLWTTPVPESARLRLRADLLGMIHSAVERAVDAGG